MVDTTLLGDFEKVAHGYTNARQMWQESHVQEQRWATSRPARDSKQMPLQPVACSVAVLAVSSKKKVLHEAQGHTGHRCTAPGPHRLPRSTTPRSESFKTSPRLPRTNWMKSISSVHG